MADTNHTVDYLLDHSDTWEDCAMIDERYNVEYFLSFYDSWVEDEIISDESLHTDSWIEKLYTNNEKDWRAIIELISEVRLLKEAKDLSLICIGNISSNEVTNTHSLGQILYTDYIHIFQISGMVLLIAMIGAIVLTFRQREGVKKQSYLKQISRERSEGVEVIEVASNKGVRIDD